MRVRPLRTCALGVFSFDAGKVSRRHASHVRGASSRTCILSTASKSSSSSSSNSASSSSAVRFTGASRPCTAASFAWEHVDALMSVPEGGVEFLRRMVHGAAGHVREPGACLVVEEPIGKRDSSVGALRSRGLRRLLRRHRGHTGILVAPALLV